MWRNSPVSVKCQKRCTEKKIGSFFSASQCRTGGAVCRTPTADRLNQILSINARRSFVSYHRYRHPGGGRADVLNLAFDLPRTRPLSSLSTVILRLLLFGIPSPSHPFIPGLKPFFSANPSHCSPSFFFFGIHYMDSPDGSLLFLSISFFYFLFFLFLHFLVVGSVR